MVGTYDASPALIGPPFGRAFDHHIGALLVIVSAPVAVGHSGRDDGDAVEGAVFFDGVLDLFPRRCFESFFVGRANGFYGTTCVGCVSCHQCCIVRPFVMVCPGYVVQGINAIGADVILLSEMGCTVRLLLVLT